MTPCLQNGSDIEVRSTSFYWPGDILVYRDRQNRLLAHRLLGYYRRQGKWKYLMQPDNARHPDMGAQASQIIGKVVSQAPKFQHRLTAVWRYIKFTGSYLSR